MVEQIRETFETVLSKVPWMDQNARNAGVAKVSLLLAYFTLAVVDNTFKHPLTAIFLYTFIQIPYVISNTICNIKYHM